MRSHTSRRVPEWSRGEDLYIGSPVLATGKVSRVTGIVPGPPEGSQGSTGWGHLSRRATWVEVGRELAPGGLVRPLGPPLRLGLETLGVGGAPLDLGGKSPPLGRCHPLEMGSPGPADPLGPLYKGGREGSRTLAPGTSLSLYNTSPSRRAWRSPAEIAATSTTTPSCC